MKKTTIILTFLLLVLYCHAADKEKLSDRFITYSQFLEAIERGEVEEVRFVAGFLIEWSKKNDLNRVYSVGMPGTPGNDPLLLEYLKKHNIIIKTQESSSRKEYSYFDAMNLVKYSFVMNLMALLVILYMFFCNLKRNDIR